MGDNEKWRAELDGIDGLSLIDISTEDDSLLFSSFLDPTSFEFSDTSKEERGFCLFGDTQNYDEEKESQKMMKTKLRKSLAWDKAFFSNAGVLEPDELSSMIDSNHVGDRKNLPAIQEDLHKSTESISTLLSDCTVETCLGSLSLEDVRASIQRSAISSDAATPEKCTERGAKKAAPIPSASRLDDSGFQGKMKSNPIRKRPSIRAQGLGKATNQPVSAKEHNTSIPRPSNGLGKTIRASVDDNKAKQEKNPKLTAGKEPLASRVPISGKSRPVVSKPLVPFKSSLRSSVASKNELTSSCSSLESCLSVFSSASNKSSLDSVKQKKDQSLKITSHSLANRPTSSAASKNIRQAKVSPSLASRTYKSKFSSPLSSSVDWSSDSLQASTATKMAKGIKKPVSGESGPAINVTTQNLKPLKNSKGLSAVHDDLKPGEQGAVHLASMMKPTGLRVPSPKIGYFDGARSSIVQTPTRSCTGLVNGLAKRGACCPNETTASRTKPGKSQPKKSPLIRESTNSKAMISLVSRSPRMIVSASPKLTKKMYSKVSAEEQLI